MKEKFNRIKANVIDWVIVGVVIAVITLGATVVSVAVSVNAYNHRYDADAEAAKGLEFTLKSGKDSDSGSVTMSAGKCTYGYFQKSGTTKTKYILKKKKVDSSSYSVLKKEFTIYSNNNYEGSYYFATSKYSQKYDIKLEKKNNKNSKTVFEIDLGIE